MPRSYVIGRSPYADVVLGDTSVAERHAEVVLTDDGRCYLTDCASPQGTWHRGEAGWTRLRQAFVEADAPLRLGEHHCTLGGLLGPRLAGGDEGRPGRWRVDLAPEAGRDMPRGRVERDPRTGEVVPKRV